ncbi:MAG: triose-phosphate isomerase [Pseudomonadota bacterium]
MSTPSTRKPIVIGNWKMNGTRESLGEIEALNAGLIKAPAAADVMVCPPATLLSEALTAASTGPATIGAQDCHAEASGAHTGDISAEMIADLGGSGVIVGHSERRQNHGETDAVVAAKARAAWRAGLIAIVCIGETEAERDAGDTLSVLARQIAGSVPEGATADRTILAYEPVWAIGTGRTPTEAEIEDTHGALRKELERHFGAQATGMRILYGGSVKPGNAASILPLGDVDGALVGGASLKVADLRPIIDAA